MEMIGLMLFVLFWPGVLILWLVAGHSAARKFGRPARIVRNFGVAVWLALVLMLSFFAYQGLFLNYPLEAAVQDGNVARVKVLLDRGACPNLDDEGVVPLIEASEAGNVAIVRLLLEHGARPNVRRLCGGPTALAVAERNGHTDVVKLLKQAGAKDDTGHTPPL